MSRLGKRSVSRALEPQLDGSERTPLDFVVLPSAVEEQMASATTFREYRGLIQSSPGAAFRLAGLGNPDRFAVSPIPEGFRALLRRDFGLSATASECFSPCARLRELVASSFRQAIPEVQGDSSRANLLKQVIAYRALYARLYDSVRRPFDMRQLDTPKARGYWLGYEHGGIVSLDIELAGGVHKLALVSIISLYRAFASRASIEAVAAGEYGGYLELTEAVLAPNDDRNLVIQMAPSDAGLYLSNLTEKGRLKDAPTTAYLVHDRGVFAVDFPRLIRSFVDRPGFWLVTDTPRLGRPRRGEKDDSIAVEVSVNGRQANRFLEVDSSGAERFPFEGIAPLRAGELRLAWARQDVVLVARGGGDELWLDLDYGKPGKRRTSRIALRNELEQRGILQADDFVLADIDGLRTDRTRDRDFRFLVQVTIEARSANDFEGLERRLVVLLVRIDCRADGSILSAVGYRLPNRFQAAEPSTDTLFANETLVLSWRTDLGRRMLAFDSVSGTLTTLPSFARYGWLDGSVAQSTTMLSVLTRELDSSAGVSSARDYGEQRRIEGFVMQPRDPATFTDTQ